MTRLLQALYRRLGPRYPRLAVAAVFPLSAIVALAGLWLLTLYQPTSTIVQNSFVLIGWYSVSSQSPARATIADRGNTAATASRG